MKSSMFLVLEITAFGLMMGGCSVSLPSWVSADPLPVDSVTNSASVHSDSDMEKGLLKTEESKEKTITFTDDLGRKLSLEKPQKVASLLGSFADMWILAGGQASLCAAAADAWSSFDLPLDQVENLGDVKHINAELLLRLQPDLVLASAKNESQKELLSLLEKSQIPVAYFDVSTFDEYASMMEILTRLSGDEEAYQKQVLDQKTRMEEIQKKAVEAAGDHPPVVLYVRAAGNSVSVKNSHGTVLGTMLQKLQADNIADRVPSLLENLSLEVLLQQDPDFIFLICQGSDSTKAMNNLKKELLDQPLFARLKAVQSDQVYVMDPTLYNLKPNARWAEAFEKLYEILYETRT